MDTTILAFTIVVPIGGATSSTKDATTKETFGCFSGLLFGKMRGHSFTSNLKRAIVRIMTVQNIAIWCIEQQLNRASSVRSNGYSVVETSDERIVEKNRISAAIIAEVITACSRRAQRASHWTGWRVRLLHENFRLYNSLPNSKFFSTDEVYMGSLFDLFGCCSAAPGWQLTVSSELLLPHTCMYVQHTVWPLAQWQQYGTQCLSQEIILFLTFWW